MAANFDTNLFANDPARDDLLVLVDAFDQPQGEASKEQTHREGLLHRAFSVVVMRESDQGPKLLLAKRAQTKYHSGGLWANSCCSHPRVGEELNQAVVRRVQEELGIDVHDAKEIGAFIYRTAFHNGLVEYEYDHVFVAYCEEEPTPDPKEAEALRWVTPEELSSLLLSKPRMFASWAPTVFSLVLPASS